MELETLRVIVAYSMLLIMAVGMIIYAAFCMVPKEPVTQEIERCYCLSLGRWYYTEQGGGYTKDQNRAHRFTLEEAVEFRTHNLFYNDYKIEAIPSRYLM